MEQMKFFHEYLEDRKQNYLRSTERRKKGRELYDVAYDIYDELQLISDRHDCYAAQNLNYYTSSTSLSVSFFTGKHTPSIKKLTDDLFDLTEEVEATYGFEIDVDKTYKDGRRIYFVLSKKESEHELIIRITVDTRESCLAIETSEVVKTYKYVCKEDLI